MPPKSMDFGDVSPRFKGSTQMEFAPSLGHETPRKGTPQPAQNRSESEQISLPKMWRSGNGKCKTTMFYNE
jgi:hypothetical protein